MREMTKELCELGKSDCVNINQAYFSTKWTAMIWTQTDIKTFQRETFRIFLLCQFNTNMLASLWSIIKHVYNLSMAALFLHTHSKHLSNIHDQYQL